MSIGSNGPHPGLSLQTLFHSWSAEMAGFLKTLVRLESPTEDKAAVDRCTFAVVSFLRRQGLSVKRLPAASVGDLFLIDLRPRKTLPGAKPLLLLAHSDTVWPVGALSLRPLRIKGDRLYGPGALDMKAGLVQSCFALKALGRLRLEPRRPIRLLINSAEETGNPEANRIIRCQSLASDAVLCLEPCLPGGALKTRRKGRLVIRLDTYGRQAHAGSPQAGVNALEEMMRQLLRLRRLRRGGTTVNIGRVEGGRAANVVAERATAILDVRFWRAEERKVILDTFAAFKPVQAGARVAFRLQSETPPLERTDVSRRLFRRARRIAAGMGLNLREGKTGGGSDASLASSLGLPTLDGLGPDGGGIHAENEHVLLSSLVDRTALLTCLLLEL